mmetsp:Transcript_114984/g.332240  ORF Transcript_114984/g.332240 Transcript_114984/m.332240 type:complete len:92 (+) Transcript_114984:364-639(+)
MTNDMVTADMSGETAEFSMDNSTRTRGTDKECIHGPMARDMKESFQRACGMVMANIPFKMGPFTKVNGKEGNIMGKEHVHGQVDESTKVNG